MYRVKIFTQDPIVAREVESCLGVHESRNLPYDVAVFDKSSFHEISQSAIKHSFLLYIIDHKDELDSLGFVPNAWIYRSKISTLSELIRAGKKELDAYQTGRILRETTANLYVHYDVHEHNLGMIREGMRTSAREIRDIFEAQVAEMRQIHSDIISAKENMVFLSMNIDNQEPVKMLEESVEHTEDILSRTNKVIKAMFGFVSILQCEDRITQMLDGITSVVESDKEQILGLDGAYDDPQVISDVKKSMVHHYTIQEQRDFAMGTLKGFESCKTQIPDIDDDDFILF